MKTLSITEALRELGHSIQHFQQVSTYNVEFGLWDFSKKPYVKLYVACYPNGQFRHHYIQAENFYQALADLQQWYEEVSRVTYVLEISSEEQAAITAF